ncbi:STM4014 family protein [Chryseolinea sp. T2]|uniref:STM4014 family protein n=1 Tax=Chryseolinea sp. T2 TaxID=3129255 RepID=UPI00307773D5
MHIVLVCNPGNRRAKMFCDAMRRLRLPDAQVLSYQDILDGNVSVADYLTPSALLRIESPGEDFGIEKRLIALGAAINCNGRAERISFEDALRLGSDHGRIRFLRQWYLGYDHLLQRLGIDVTQSGCRVFNSPESIGLMFDKVRCHDLLKSNGVPVPERTISAKGYDELRQALRNQQFKRVFVKPAHGSSASGVIAYRMQGDKEEVFTSVELVENGSEYRLYNTLQPRRYNDRGQIRRIVNFILSEGAIIEEWIPKETLNSKFFDVRVVVINGRARVVLPRLSNGAITNLHLGNERGESLELQQLMGERFAGLAACAERAAVTAGAFYAGVDVLVTAGSHQPRVLELNAFGDLLPGVSTNTGDDLYTCALKERLNETSDF